MPRFVVFVPLALAGACGGGPAHTGSPTWSGNVAAIVHTSCTPCHRPGGPAPFSLRAWDDARKRADQIVEVTQGRLMPPWLPTHGNFVGDRRLQPAQIELLLAWAAAGAPRGDAGAEPPCPEFPSGWQLREPDLVLSLPQSVGVAAAGPDVVRNFVVPVDVAAVKFVEAVEIQPGNPAVHHAVLLVDSTGRSRRLDAQDAEPGFPGMVPGNARPPDGQFVGWTPGKQVRPCAPGMAWRLSPGDDLVLQLHLSPTGTAAVVQPRLGLYFTATPPSAVLYPLLLKSEQIDLAPGEADHAVTDQFVIPVPVVVHSLYPHAHYLCRSMAATVTPPGGAPALLFRIERWDFDWQDDYTFREPVALPAGTRVEFEYRYDNSAGNPQNPSRPPVRVRYGQDSTDEMASLTLQVTTADVAARLVLGEAGLRRDLQRAGYDSALHLQLATLLRDRQRYDEALQEVARVRAREPGNADALCEQGACLERAGRTGEAEQAYGECLALDPAQNVARVQLANILTRSGRAAAAIPLYQEALARAPKLAAVRHNLAGAYAAVGQAQLAEQQYREAVALDATFFPSWLALGRLLAATGRGHDARAALQRADALRPGDAAVRSAMEQLGR